MKAYKFSRHFFSKFSESLKSAFSCFARPPQARHPKFCVQLVVSCNTKQDFCCGNLFVMAPSVIQKHEGFLPTSLSILHPTPRYEPRCGSRHAAICGSHVSASEWPFASVKLLGFRLSNHPIMDVNI